MFGGWFNKAKATSVAQLVDGKTATLRGTVRAGVGRVKAPLSARDTAYYLIAVEGTEPPFTEGDGLPFFLAVGTDTVAVDPRGAIPVFHPRHTDAYRADHAAAVQFEATRHFQRWRSFASWDLSLFHEWRLDDGVELEISGAAFRNVQAAQQQQGNYRDSTTQWLLRSTPTTPLMMRWR